MPVELVAQFYIEHFGMKLVYRGKEMWQYSDNLQVELKIIKLKMPGTRALLELVEHKDNWLPHLAFDVEQWPNVHLKDLKRVDKDHDGIEVKFCLDPTGNCIELVRRLK